MISPTLIHLDRITLGYGQKVILRDITVTIRQGEYFGLVGPNGAGKTTLLKAMLGILKPSGGTRTAMHPDGRPLRFGYVPQRDSIDSVLPYTSSAVVMMGRFRQMGLFRLPGRTDTGATLRALAQVGVESLADKAFRNLSGGQKQRVLIARALASDPDILILDEPTNGMDLTSRTAMLELIDTLHRRERLTIIMVSHLLDDVANHVEQIAIVEKDFFRVGDVREILTPAHLSALYGMPVNVDALHGHVVVTVGGAHESN